MRGAGFLEKLELIDPKYLLEAEQAPLSRRRLPRWGVALAACLALLAGTGAALAAGGYGIRLLDAFTGRRYSPDYSESGYDLAAEVERFPVSDFTGEAVREAGERIVAQYEAYEPWMSFHPGSYWREFAAPQEALDYIGLAALRSPDLGLEVEGVEVSASGDSTGRVEEISFVVRYRADTLRMTASALLFTEHSRTGISEEDITLRVRTTEDVAFTEDLYTTAAGKQCHILTSDALESGYHCLDGYLVTDGIVYSAWVPYLAEDEERAVELLRRWADQL